MPLSGEGSAQLRGRLVRRYKRFLAEVLFDDGSTVTAHCPNPGAMTGCAVPGTEVLLSRSDDPRRRLAHTWELARAGRTWVCINTAVANRVVGGWLKTGRLFPGEGAVRAEVPVGRSRFDFLLGDRTLVEVKSVTLKVGGFGAFPDSVTARGRRHVEELAALREYRRILLYFVARGDVAEVRSAEEVDPGYAAAVRAARRAGVEVCAVGARFAPGRPVACRGWLRVKL